MLLAGGVRKAWRTRGGRLGLDPLHDLACDEHGFRGGCSKARVPARSSGVPRDPASPRTVRTGLTTLCFGDLVNSVRHGLVAGEARWLGECDGSPLTSSSACFSLGLTRTEPVGSYACKDVPGIIGEHQKASRARFQRCPPRTVATTCQPEEECPGAERVMPTCKRVFGGTSGCGPSPSQTGSPEECAVSLLRGVVRGPCGQQCAIGFLRLSQVICCQARIATAQGRWGLARRRIDVGAGGNSLCSAKARAALLHGSSELL